MDARRPLRSGLAGTAAQERRRRTGIPSAGRRSIRRPVAAADCRPGARQSILHRGAGAQVRRRRPPRRRARSLPPSPHTRHEDGPRQCTGDRGGARRQPARNGAHAAADGRRHRSRVHGADPGACRGAGGIGREHGPASPVDGRTCLRDRRSAAWNLRFQAPDASGSRLPLAGLGQAARAAFRGRRRTGEDTPGSGWRPGGLHRLPPRGGGEHPAGGFVQHEGRDVARHARSGAGARSLEARPASTSPSTGSPAASCSACRWKVPHVIRC